MGQDLGMMGDENGKVGRDLKTEDQFSESRLYSVGIVNSFKNRTRFSLYSHSDSIYGD